VLTDPHCVEAGVTNGSDLLDVLSDASRYIVAGMVLGADEDADLHADSFTRVLRNFVR
jgi:hypothetical protein